MLTWGIAAAGLVVVAAAAGLAVLKSKVDGYVDPGQRAVSAAGFIAKTARLGELAMSYVEGPGNGPPLVLLHAQHMDWFSYNLVLPRLARSFHVFVIDYPGHGKTTVPDDYPMTAGRIGGDLADFLATVVGGPAYVSGNSSGGLLAIWLAANRPELVRAVLLEDPPLFAAEQSRIATTIAYRSFITSYHAVREQADDFLLYWIDSNAKFFTKRVGPGSAFALTQAVKSYRAANPGEPVEIGLLANATVRQFVRGLDTYDARFGAAFYDGTWNKDFDHAEALETIGCPVLLLHANFEILDDGTLNGAMTQEDADRAMALLRHGTYVRVGATHVVHLDQPDRFAEILEGFFSGEAR